MVIRNGWNHQDKDEIQKMTKIKEPKMPHAPIDATHRSASNYMGSKYQSHTPTSQLNSSFNQLVNTQQLSSNQRIRENQSRRTSCDGMIVEGTGNLPGKSHI